MHEVEEDPPDYGGTNWYDEIFPGLIRLYEKDPSAHCHQIATHYAQSRCIQAKSEQYIACEDKSYRESCVVDTRINCVH